MRIGVVGSRTFSNYAFLKQSLDGLRSLHGDFTVVSGGAPGADTLAERWAKSIPGMPEPVVHRAVWDDLTQPGAVIKTSKTGRKYDALAGFRRNQKIIDDSDLLVAFWDLESKGTKDSLERAKRKGIPIIIFVWPHDGR